MTRPPEQTGHIDLPPAAQGPVPNHVHKLTECSECDGTGLSDYYGGPCPDCNARGYFEMCRICGEPMGNKRRKWKRERDYLAELDARIAHCQACARRRLNPHHCDT